MIGLSSARWYILIKRGVAAMALGKELSSENVVPFLDGSTWMIKQSNTQKIEFIAEIFLFKAN